jgi:hypothetical protein
MLQLKILGVVTIIGVKRHAFRVSFEQSLIGMLYHRNLDARAPPAPRDSAPLLLRPAPVLLTLLTLLTAPWRSQDPSHYKLSTFNEGPRNKVRGPQNGTIAYS